jgi:O-antigen ligase
MEPQLASAAAEASPSGPGARGALFTLVALVVLSPWPFGSVDPWATRTIALVSLAVAAAAFAWDARRGSAAPPADLLWPLAALGLLAVLQVVPLPRTLHRVVAPGSAEVWYPNVAAAAEVVGPGPHALSVYPRATRRWFALTSGVLALALAAAPALRERRLALRSACTIVAASVAVALYGLVARVTFGDKLYGVFSVPTIAPFGPFVNKNHFAGFVVLSALLAAGLGAGLASEARRGPGLLSWIESTRARYVILAWGAAAVLALAVPVSLSRAGVLGLAAGLLAFVSMRLWRRTRRPSRSMVIVAIAFAMVGAMALARVMPDVVHERIRTLASPTTDLSGSFRLELWRDVVVLVGSSPYLGTGFGAFEDALRRLKTGSGDMAVQHAENDLLELVAEGGLGAGLCVVASAVAVFRRALNGAGRSREPLQRGLIVGSTAGLVALLFHSGLGFNLRVPSIALLSAALLSMAVAPASCQASSRRQRIVALALLLPLLAAFWSPWSESGVEPNGLRRAAVSHSSSLRRLALESDLVGALRRRPANAAAWLSLAWLRLADAPDHAAALAGWAVRLDPTNRAVRDESSRVLRSSRAAGSS